MSRGHTEKMYSLFGHEKVFLLQRKSVKTLSDKIYGSLNLLLDTYASNICPIKCPWNIKSPGDIRIKCISYLVTKKSISFAKIMIKTLGRRSWEGERRWILKEKDWNRWWSRIWIWPFWSQAGRPQVGGGGAPLRPKKLTSLMTWFPTWMTKKVSIDYIVDVG